MLKDLVEANMAVKYKINLKNKVMFSSFALKKKDRLVKLTLRLTRILSNRLHLVIIL